MSKKAEENNVVDTMLFERKALGEGFKSVAGIDEAGRGPLAGPVVASAVVIRDEEDFVERIDDSKKLTEKRREKAFFEILKKSDVGIGIASVEEIDSLNILNATLLAMKRAVLELEGGADFLLVDGKMEVPLSLPRKCIIRGETYSKSIACASIIAKVFRDKIMLDEDRKYPVYGFARHKGYGTAMHLAAIREHGFSPIHRRTFGPFGDKRNKG